jgi:hypothetical protein
LIGKLQNKHVFKMVLIFGRPVSFFWNLLKNINFVFMSFHDLSLTFSDLIKQRTKSRQNVWQDKVNILIDKFTLNVFNFVFCKICLLSHIIIRIKIWLGKKLKLLFKIFSEHSGYAIVATDCTIMYFQVLILRYITNNLIKEIIEDHV